MRCEGTGGTCLTVEGTDTKVRGNRLETYIGETVEAARANSSPQVVIMQSPEGPGDDTPYGNSGMMIGFVVDPEGNRIELIEPPPR